MKTTAKQIGIILLASAVLAVVANSVHPRKIPWVQDWSRQVEAKARDAGIKVVPLSIALELFMSGECVFVDARPSGEFSEGHVSGAVSLPFQMLDDHFPDLADLLDSEKEMVVYCANRECDDALLLASELGAMGASNLVLYIDGFDLWEKHGGAVEAAE